MRNERFHDPRLTCSENKACEMLFNGLARAEIADEMNILPRSLSRLFQRARHKGVDVPLAKRGGPPHGTVPLKTLVAMRARLGRHHGVNMEIGAAVGLSADNVRTRLWKHDQRQARGAHG